MVHRINSFGAAFVAPALLWQLAFFVFPLVFLIALTFWRVEFFRPTPDFIVDNWVKVYGQAYFWRALTTTAGFSLAAAVLVSVVVFPLSCVVAFKMSPAYRRLTVMALIVPFFTSYLVRIYSWQIYLGENGIINAALGFLDIGPLRMLSNAFGMFVGYFTLTLPLAALLQIFGLSFVDRDLIKAAQNLGCKPLRALFAVAVPAAKPALVVAALFVFILVFGDYASSVYLGGGTIQTTTTLIADLTKGGQQWPRAAVVAVTMIVVLLASTLAGLRYAYRGR